MRPAADFNNTSVRTYRLKRLKQLAHAVRRPLHRIDDLFFMPANVFRLTFLVSELPFERPVRKLLPRLVPPTHFLGLSFFPFVPFVLFCG
jgi:hypothetical protein